MKRRLRQNDTNISEIYIGRPIYISDVQYLYPTSDIYFRRRISLPKALALLKSGIVYQTSDIYIGRPKNILDIRKIYWMSDIYIGRPIYIWTSDIDFGNIGVILSQTAPHTYIHTHLLLL